MNKKRIILLSITTISVVIGLIILFQLLPYINIRNCQVSQEMNLTNITLIVKNNGDQPAKFPKMKFKLYRDSTFVGNGSIEEFVVPPHSEVRKPIKFDIRAKLTELPNLISAKTTIIDGTIYIRILWGVNIPINYEVESNENGSVVKVLGREIVVG